MTKPLSFAPGDVIQTTPFPGYWGCAVVLTAFRKTEEFHPIFHVGITPVVFLHEYEFEELDIAGLTIMKVRPKIRVAPFEYAPMPEQTCIGMYTARTPKGIRVLGSIDPKALYSKRLTRRIGDGTGSSFPLCGPMRSNIGHTAVHAWREIHDAEAVAKECAEAEASFEAFDADRLAKQREAARAKKRK